MRAAREVSGFTCKHSRCARSASSGASRHLLPCCAREKGKESDIMHRPKLPPRFRRIDTDTLLREYREKVPVKEIRARHKLEDNSLYALLDHLKEPRRRPVGNRTRRSAAERLKKFAENQVLNFEREIRAAKESDLSEDNVAKMMSIARALEQIMKLQPGRAAGNDVAQHNQLVAITDERRRELARRLAALCAASGPSVSAEGAA